MLRSSIIFLSCLIICACGKQESNKSSIEDFEKTIDIKHLYDALNPYSVATENAKVLIDLPKYYKGKQEVFGLTMPSYAKLYKNNSEQYVEVRLEKLEAKQKKSITVSYTLGLNSTDELPQKKYIPIFTDLIKHIEINDAESLEYIASLKLVVDGWAKLQKKLPLDLDTLDEVKLDIVQRFIAAELLLSTGIEGWILTGFACETEADCAPQKQKLWLEYKKDKAIQTIVINGDLKPGEYLIPVKNVVDITSFNDFVSMSGSRSGSVQAIGVVLEVDK